MADNTEELKLDTAQPEKALDSLLAKVRRLQGELKNTTTSFSKLQGFDRAATAQPVASSSSPTSATQRNWYDRLATAGPSPAFVTRLNSLPAGFNNLGQAFGKLQTNLSNFANVITNQARGLGNLGGGGGGGGPPGGGAGSPPQGRRSYLGQVTRRVGAYSAIGAGFAGLLGSIKEIVDLDNELHNLQAITKTSDAGMGSLKTTILGVAGASKFMVAQVAQAAVVLGQAGLSAEQIAEALKSVVTLATASGTSLAEAANLVTTMLDAFNLNATEAKDIANLFTSALNQTKLTAEQLAQGLNFSSEAAAELGLSAKDTTVLLAGLADAGLKQVGNLRPLLLDLNEPSKKLQETLARLGISLDDIDVRTKPVIAVIRTLSEKGFTAADAFASLNARGATALTALMGNLGHVQELSQSLTEAASASDAAAVQMKSLENTARNTFTAFVSVAAVSLQPLLDGLQAVLGATGDLFKTLLAVKGILPAIGPILGAIATRSVLGVGLRAAGAIGAIGSGAAAAGAVGGPWGLAAAISIGVVASAVSLLGTKTKETAKDTEEATASASLARDKYNEVEKAISALITQEKALKANKEDLKARTLELGEKFRDLGLDVRGLGGDFDALLEKMKALDGTAHDALGKSLDLLQARQKAQLDDARAGLGPASIAANEELRATPFAPRGGANLAERYAQFGDSSVNIRSVLGRVAAGKPFGEGDANLVQGAQLDLLKQRPAPSAAGRAEYDRFENFLEAQTKLIGNVVAQQKALDAQGNARKTVDAQGNLGFRGLEEGARNLYGQLNDNIPKRNGNDPVGTEAALRAYRAKIAPQIRQYTDAYNSYGVQGNPQAAAVAASQALKDLKGITDEIDRRVADVKDDAIKIRDELSGLATADVERRLANLQRQISQTETQDDLTNLSVQISETIRELYKRKAEEFAQKVLKLGPGDYSVPDYGQLNLHPTGRGVNAVEREQVKGFNSDFQNAVVAPPLLAIGANDKIKTDRILRDTITGISGEMAALDLQIQDAFKNTDQNTPSSIIQAAADKAMKTLGAEYALAIDKLQKEAELDPLISKEELANRRATIDSEFASKGEALTDRTKELKYDYSRPLTGSDSVYKNVGTYLSPNARESAPGYDWQKNALSDSMISGLESAKTGFATFFSDIATGQKGVVAGFRAMGRGILQAMLSVLSDAIAKQFLKTILGFLPGFGGAGASAGIGNGGVMALSATEGLSKGGYIKGYASGGYSGQDTVPARLTPGEFVLRNAAVAGIGRDNLEHLNAMGNSRSSSSIPMYKPPPPGVTNVYVVSPQRQPQLGKNDILVTISEDILAGGPTKRLIKSVAMGH